MFQPRGPGALDLARGNCCVSERQLKVARTTGNAVQIDGCLRTLGHRKTADKAPHQRDYELAYNLVKGHNMQ